MTEPGAADGLVHTRRALGFLVDHALPDRLPLQDWLDSAVWRAQRDPESTCAGPASWLPCATILAQDLRALGVLPRESGAPPLLELALLTDGLDPGATGTSPLQRDLHRRLLRSDQAPADHAACCLRTGEPLRWPLLGHPELSARIAARAAELLDELEPSLLPAGHATLVALDEHRLRLGWAAMAARLSQSRPSTLLAEALACATALVDPAPFLAHRCQAAWERQRAGVLGHGPLEGDLFVPLLMIEALARAGFHASGSLREILEARLDQGLRYYRNSHWMPHDADDAAAVLLALGATGSTLNGLERLEAQALEVLAEASSPDGAIRTWVQLPGQHADPPPAKWHGQDCIGVAARALRALLTRANYAPAELQRCAAWLAGRADPDGGFTSDYYPERVVTTGLVVEALAACQAAGLTGAWRTSLDTASAWLLHQQRPDGSWPGGAEACASAMLALDAAKRLPPATAADGAAWLARTQRWDGTWAAGAFMLCPQGDGQLGPFGNVALASAMALAALVSARRVLEPFLAAPESA